MTTEQAIKLLHRLQDEQFDGIHGDERREALSMAVTALSSQQTDTDSQGLVNDCISRKMAIDAVSKWLYDVFGIKKSDGTATIFKRLRDLPSAQPQRKKGEWEEIEVIPEAYDIAGVKTWASMMRCNQCGFATFAIEGHFAQYDFCPSCGADMRGESDDCNNYN